MLFDFCTGPSAASGEPYGLDTIYQIWGDATYQTPRKAVTPGKRYIVFTTSGEGLIRYDGASYRVAEGETLVMHPHEGFSYGCPGDTWHFWWFELCMPQPFLPEDRILPVAPDALMLNLFGRSLLCARQGRWDIAQSLLVSAMMLAQDRLERNAAAPGSAEICRAERFIRENLQDVTVASLCEELGIAERTLRTLCHRALGCGPKQLISRLRLETAQQLLANTAMPLHAIAENVGFSSAFHLSRSFKAYFHVTPSEYRRSGML